MPLAFDTTNLGTVAFGYFNIDTDLLLLDNQLFFTNAFTTAVDAIAGSEPGEPAEQIVEGWMIDDPRDMGSVMGAIHGADLSGLIGEVYRHFAFPPRPDDFWQRAEGENNRPVVEPMLARWARAVDIPVQVAADASRATVGRTEFDAVWFRELVAYVWRGGYPRWLNGRRPPSVEAMRAAIERSHHPLFEGQLWDLTLRPC